jgi:hypothetical protein
MTTPREWFCRGEYTFPRAGRTVYCVRQRGHGGLCEGRDPGGRNEIVRWTPPPAAGRDAQ